MKKLNRFLIKLTERFENNYESFSDNGKKFYILFGFFSLGIFGIGIASLGINYLVGLTGYPMGDVDFIWSITKISLIGFVIFIIFTYNRHKFN